MSFVQPTGKENKAVKKRRLLGQPTNQPTLRRLVPRGSLGSGSARSSSDACSCGSIGPLGSGADDATDAGAAAAAAAAAGGAAAGGAATAGAAGAAAAPDAALGAGTDIAVEAIGLNDVLVSSMIPTRRQTETQ